MGDTSDNNQNVSTSEVQTTSEDTSIHSRLRTHKPNKSLSKCPVRKASQNIQYLDKYDDIDLPPTPFRPKRAVKPSTGPSAERIAAHGKKTVQPLCTHRLTVRKPIKVETKTKSPQVSNQDDIKNTSNSDFSDEDNLPLSSFRENSDATKVSPKKRVLIIRKIGLVKRRRKCTCKCPVCSQSYPTQGELNRHYRQCHNKVACSKCNLMFTSPSTLTRHMYTHAELRFNCHCGKSYHFAAELCVHKLTHR